MKEYKKELKRQGITEGEQIYLIEKFDSKEEAPSLDLDSEIKKLFLPERIGAFPHYICLVPKLWGYLLRGEGENWQEKLMGNQNFSIDSPPESFYDSCLYKKGPLLYYINKFLFLTVGLSIWNGNGVTLKCLFSIDHDRWLPEKVMNVLFPSDFVNTSVSWFSHLTPLSDSLIPSAQKIKDLLTRVAQHELIEGSEFDSAVKEFKSFYEQVCSDISKNKPLNLKYDSTALDAYKNTWRATFFGCFTPGETNNPLSNKLPTVRLETIFQYL